MDKEGNKRATNNTKSGQTIVLVHKSEVATCKGTKERYSWKIAKVAKLLYLSAKMDKEGNKRANNNTPKVAKPSYWCTKVAIQGGKWTKT